MATDLYVLGNAAGAAATASLTRKLDQDGGTAHEQLHDAMAKAHQIAMHYPRLRARLETSAAADYAASPDQTFEFGLHALLDGLRGRLGGPTAAGRADRAVDRK
ncbi:MULTISPECIES: TetR/AcrR family transcriptional regulator C-terminal domain-containing protein [Actinomadura]|uniref:TetR/AcrR family transcriptional regulator C-terminal domain-containing protein n=1 Tax=Actinomadura TaxID=1988 RepID=UPI001F1073AE|nr:TetR/AcrR family transcriptional regulator C-terminal domain-containing protein [Actinomadura geliboluensis]